ncbi:hypothetical protein KSP40_PGU009218 [Platanthera guangdongensis]|uniref:Uncharacterized protein n=1 Tax=Platanthera guangdongensis TaxID=2320717 RepID=A0ABR2MH68_9ASPA
MERNNGGMNLYWKRRTYERVGIGGARRRRTKTSVELGGGRRRRSMLQWKVKISPKLQFLRSVSPKRVLARFNEGYIRIMQRLARFLSPAVGGKELGGLPPPEPLVLAYQKRIVERYCTLVAEREWIAAVSGIGAVGGVGAVRGLGAVKGVGAAS